MQEAENRDEPSLDLVRTTNVSVLIPVIGVKRKAYLLWIVVSVPFYILFVLLGLLLIVGAMCFFFTLGHFVLDSTGYGSLEGLQSGFFMLVVLGLIVKLNHATATLFYGKRLSSTPQMIHLTKSKILFPAVYKFSMLERLERSWDDVHIVDFSLAVTPQLVHEWADVKGRLLTMDFKSGGSAAIDLQYMEKRDVEKFLEAVDIWCASNVLSERAALLHRYVLCADDQAPLSLTSIWTESMHLHFATTNFAPLKSGTELNNDYRLRMQLACNGFSAVYLADDNHQQKVIIKESVLPVDMQDEVKVKARELFEREAALLSKVDHPNIVKVLDFFVEKQREYIVLQYVPGMNLRQVRQGGSNIPEETLRTYARQILEILNYLHSLSPPILHRDLTPDNLIVDASGKITLIDFGASNEYVGQATGTLIGKQSYIPPEQFKGKAIPASDVFAFGATMFFLVTGDDPVPLSESVCSSSSSLMNGIIEECTKLDAEKRPSVRVLLDRIVST